ncbi:hypothetical protein Taro_006694 [Colocasia esculenta]|uniref:Uncharacterized protein n=1 Tax=Colocasia esculenta TaxID=4460 RepID=A0A843TRX4_COLES|nr:hypothetical protein [Colocasia esculenta]
MAQQAVFSRLSRQHILSRSDHDRIPRRDLPAQSDEPVATIKRPRHDLPAQIDKPVAFCTRPIVISSDPVATLTRVRKLDDVTDNNGTGPE